MHERTLNPQIFQHILTRVQYWSPNQLFFFFICSIELFSIGLPGWIRAQWRELHSCLLYSLMYPQVFPSCFLAHSKCSINVLLLSQLTVLETCDVRILQLYVTDWFPFIPSLVLWPRLKDMLVYQLNKYLLNTCDLVSMSCFGLWLIPWRTGFSFGTFVQRAWCWE